MEHCIALTAEENYLILFVFTKITKAEYNLEDLIRSEIAKRLPAHYEPRKIVILEFDNLPITSHGISS